MLFYFLLGCWLIKIDDIVSRNLFKINCAIYLVLIEFNFASVCFYRFIRKLNDKTPRKHIFIIIFLYSGFSNLYLMVLFIVWGLYAIFHNTNQNRPCYYTRVHLQEILFSV